MIKYLDTAVVFSEIPDEVTLAIEITNCPGHCEGCHSPWLRDDIGEELTPEVLNDLIGKNQGITCVCFMGEGRDPEALKKLAYSIKTRSGYPYKTALYSGSYELDKDYDRYFDYLKIGPYIPEKKALNFKTTNQRLYEIEREYDPVSLECTKTERKDITFKFWRKD